MTVLAAAATSELFGYWLHKLLHSNKIEFLSRSHMIHHLVLYGPDKPLRTPEYVDSVAGRAAIFGLGLEWIAPVGIMLAVLAGLFQVLRAPFAFQALFFAVALGWGVFMFSYIHDAMHVKGFWMETNPFFKNWYLDARSKHDIHHLTLSDEGKMTKNFGICFFLFDRVFGTFQKVQNPFNKKGLEAALQRYAFVFKEFPSAS